MKMLLTETGNRSTGIFGEYNNGNLSAGEHNTRIRKPLHWALVG